MCKKRIVTATRSIGGMYFFGELFVAGWNIGTRRHAARNLDSNNNPKRCFHSMLLRICLHLFVFWHCNRENKCSRTVSARTPARLHFRGRCQTACLWYARTVHWTLAHVVTDQNHTIKKNEIEKNIYMTMAFMFGPVSLHSISFSVSPSIHPTKPTIYIG